MSFLFRRVDATLAATAEPIFLRSRSILHVPSPAVSTLHNNETTDTLKSKRFFGLGYEAELPKYYREYIKIRFAVC